MGPYDVEEGRYTGLNSLIIQLLIFGCSDCTTVGNKDSFHYLSESVTWDRAL